MRYSTLDEREKKEQVLVLQFQVFAFYFRCDEMEGNMREPRALGSAGRFHKYKALKCLWHTINVELISAKQSQHTFEGTRQGHQLISLSAILRTKISCHNKDLRFKIKPLEIPAVSYVQ